ncbi:MAG: hypothetical protein K0S86_322 [Geminicoccaceae bacterium]|jgi:uncharacterized protein (DUF305 family)|nr:hypothetical protein [Geminicoccaceae bacterium]
MVLAAGCATAGRPGAAARPAPAAPAKIGIPALKHTAADVRFMRGMIHHHAQAVLMAKWAPTHGAGADLQRLAERIVVAQEDEIALMQQWLRSKGEPVPEPTPGPMRMTMPDGTEHDMLMPGMLTGAELEQLDAARGVEFDRLFLTFMIRHHEGALDMVDELFGSQGAAQDEDTFRLASDVFADQTTEIRVMKEMLAARQSSPGPR